MICKGFRFAGVAAGVKKKGGLDVGLIAADAPAATAAVFTSNRVKAAPVLVSTDMLRAGASLREVGQVLRHNDDATTAIYAKVDQASLSTVTRPWPEPTR